MAAEVAFSDEQVLVIDCGSGLIKVGWSGEDCPQLIHSTVISRVKTTADQAFKHASGTNKFDEFLMGNAAIQSVAAFPNELELQRPIIRREVQDWDSLIQMFERIYSNDLRTESELHPVLFTGGPNGMKYREKLADTFFRHFRVPSLSIANSSVLSLYSSGHTRGLVLEVGDGSTQAVPIFEGYALPHGIETLNVGGADLTDRLLFELSQMPRGRGSGNLRLDVARDIKEKLCMIRPTAYKPAEKGEIVEYELPDGEILQINEMARYSVGELLFQPGQGVPDMIDQSIAKCDPALQIDLRKCIVLSGGTTLMNGFADRVSKQISSAQGLTKINAPRKHAAWIGGSMFASLPTFSQVKITKQEYEEGDDIVHKKFF